MEEEVVWTVGVIQADLASGHHLIGVILEAEDVVVKEAPRVLHRNFAFFDAVKGLTDVVLDAA